MPSRTSSSEGRVRSNELDPFEVLQPKLVENFNHLLWDEKILIKILQISLEFFGKLPLLHKKA